MLFVYAAWLYAPLLVRSMTRCEITSLAAHGPKPSSIAAVALAENDHDCVQPQSKLEATLR